MDSSPYGQSSPYNYGYADPSSLAAQSPLQQQQPHQQYQQQQPPAAASSPAAAAAAYGSPLQQQQQQPTTPTQSLRRRGHLDGTPQYNINHNINNNGNHYGGGGSSSSESKYTPRKQVVKKLDFMFPKVDTEYTVRTERGGLISLIAYGLIAILAVAEAWTWMSQNSSTIEHVAVDTSLGKRMRVNLNVTFPGLACEDLHIDIMDVAGDSQLDLEDTMTKRRLNRRGLPMGPAEIVESNKHRVQQNQKEKIQEEKLPDDYCGPCYGAADDENACCNTCDELVEAYKKKRWRHDILMQTAEQCIREGKDKLEPKRLRKGEGCNLAGYFMLNRVGGNFHIAMGEGIERDGRHIHTFNPDETHHFNASHIIHNLSFGPEYEYEEKAMSLVPNGDKNDRSTLNGVTKIVDKSYGTTGLFQYFIKIVPTTYISDDESVKVDTNRYFFTERFRPLMKEYLDDDYYNTDDNEDEDGESKEKLDGGVKAVHTSGGKHHDDHNVKNAVLPGVFFIYEIYPFAVEIRRNNVPFTHLLIRLMATVGGVFTIVKWADSYLYSKERHR